VESDTPAEPRAPGCTSAALTLQQLYEDHLAAIYRFVYSKVGNREETEDLTAQVFLKAVHHLDQARAAESLRNWLFRVARTAIADYWRTFYRLRTNSLDDLLEGGWDGPEVGSGQTASEGPEVRVQCLLQQLPERYRQVLTYRFLHNCSIRETAAKMQVSEANVKVLQFRALKKAADVEDGEA
jgi:RNA polymerase sigma-70 factor (ECF subfamily)